MASLFLLIPLSVLVVVLSALVLLWAVNNGQFENLDALENQMPDDESTGAGQGTPPGVRSKSAHPQTSKGKT